MASRPATAPGALDPRQRYADRFETIQTHLDGRQAQIHTSMPGQIVSFNAAKMTATVQPAIQAINTQNDGTRVPVTIAAITDVPVHFPAGGGFTLTFPVKAGDECLIVFNERSIDNWHQHGGQQAPSDHRMHDINDCVVHVGLRSQANPLTGVSTTGVQLRNESGTDFVQLDATGITLKTGGAINLLATGVINIQAFGVNVSNTTGGIGEMVINANVGTAGTLKNNNVNVGSGHTHAEHDGPSTGVPR
jgi:hypothetical protein